MKPRTAKQLARDMVDYAPAVPRNSVQALALARVAATAPEPEPPCFRDCPSLTTIPDLANLPGVVSPPQPEPLYNAHEIGEFAVRWLGEHQKGSSKEICAALYGHIDDHNLRVVGNCLSARMRKYGDIRYTRVNTHSRGKPVCNVWFLVDPEQAQERSISLRDLDNRLAKLEAQQDRLLRILTSIFRHEGWPE